MAEALAPTPAAAKAAWTGLLLGPLLLLACLPAQRATCRVVHWRLGHPSA